MLIGQPDKGKTTLAIGISKEQFKGKTFYVNVDQSTQQNTETFLDQIALYNYREFLFIVDNCHNNPKFVNSLCDNLTKFSFANFLLITRNVPIDYFQDDGVNFIEEFGKPKSFGSSRIEITSDSNFVQGIVSKFCAYHKIDIDLAGDIHNLTNKCANDLSFLNEFLETWKENEFKQKLSDLDISEVFNHIRFTYLKTDEQDYLRIAVLYQYEILVLDISDFIKNAELDKEGLLVIEGKLEPENLKLFRFTHPNVAKYILDAKAEKGFRGQYENLHHYTLQTYIEYISAIATCRPIPYLAFFDIFAKLRLNNRKEFLQQLLQHTTTEKACKDIIQLFENSNSANCFELLYHFGRFIYFMWQDLGKSTNSQATLFLRMLVNIINSKGSLSTFIESLPLKVLIQVIFLALIDNTLKEAISSCNFKKLGKNVSNIGVGPLTLFLKLIIRLNLTNSTSLINSFLSQINIESFVSSFKVAGLGTIVTLFQLLRKSDVNSLYIKLFYSVLDFEELDARSRFVGKITIQNFLRLAREFDVNPASLNSFCQGLDFKLLASLAKNVGNVRHFLQLCRQCQINPTLLALYSNCLNFEELGVRSRHASLLAIRHFLQLTRQANADISFRRRFCASIDVENIGQKIKARVPELKANSIFLLSLFGELSIIFNSEMVDQLCKGIGYDELSELIRNDIGPDTYMACEVLLFSGVNDWDKKHDELKNKGIDIIGTRFNSFVNKPIVGNGAGGQWKWQQFLISNSFKKLVKDKLTLNRIKSIPTLEQWNNLVYNTYKANNNYFENNVSKILRDFSEVKYENLFASSSVKEISIFLRYFSQKNRIITWLFPYEKFDFIKLFPFEKVQHCKLRDISHYIYNLHNISREDCSSFYAMQFYGNIQLVEEKIDKESFEDTVFFVWNLYLNLPNAFGSAILNNESLANQICAKYLKDKIVVNNSKKNRLYVGLLYLTGIFVMANLGIPTLLDREINQGKTIRFYNRYIQTNEFIDPRIIACMHRIFPEAVLQEEIAKCIEFQSTEFQSEGRFRVISFLRNINKMH